MKSLQSLLWLPETAQILTEFGWEIPEEIKHETKLFTLDDSNKITYLKSKIISKHNHPMWMLKHEEDELTVHETSRVLTPNGYSSFRELCSSYQFDVLDRKGKVAINTIQFSSIEVTGYKYNFSVGEDVSIAVMFPNRTSQYYFLKLEN